MTQTTPCRSRRPVRLSFEALLAQSASETAVPEPPVLSGAPAPGCLFLCPTVTPLHYTRSFAELSPPEALRYNRLCGVAFNEVVAMFEELFGEALLPAAASSAADQPLFARALSDFEQDEARHRRWWRALNAWAEPAFPAGRGARFARVPRGLRAAVRCLCRFPRRATALFWLLLALEELSLEVARRSLALPAGVLEPQFAGAYRAHLRDEARHVQLDWYLIDRFHARTGSLLRRGNAALLRLAFGELFLTPSRLAVRVVQALADSFPRLNPLVPRFREELRALRHDGAYLELMCSPRTQPVLFTLIETYPEMGFLRKGAP